MAARFTRFIALVFFWLPVHSTRAVPTIRSAMLCAITRLSSLCERSVTLPKASVLLAAYFGNVCAGKVCVPEPFGVEAKILLREFSSGRMLLWSTRGATLEDFPLGQLLPRLCPAFLSVRGGIGHTRWTHGYSLERSLPPYCKDCPVVGAFYTSAGTRRTNTASTSVGIGFVPPRWQLIMVLAEGGSPPQNLIYKI